MYVHVEAPDATLDASLPTGNPTGAVEEAGASGSVVSPPFSVNDAPIWEKQSTSIANVRALH